MDSVSGTHVKTVDSGHLGNRARLLVLLIATFARVAKKKKKKKKHPHPKSRVVANR